VIEQIKVKNLGNIEDGSVKLNKLTIVVGQNNSGKTYLNYMLYMALTEKSFFIEQKIFEPIKKELDKNGIYKLDVYEFISSNFEIFQKTGQANIKKYIHNFFSTTEDTFQNFEIEVGLNKKKILENLQSKTISDNISLGKNRKKIFGVIKEKDSYEITFILEEKMPSDFIYSRIASVFLSIIFQEENIFLLPAERTGLNLFYRELNTKRNTLFDHLQKSDIEPLDLFKDLVFSKYPKPIADYIEFLNEIHNLKKLKTEFIDLSSDLNKTILNGRYKVDKEGITYLPYKNRQNNRNNFNKSIPIHLTSSTVKTFFSLSFYLEHIAKKGDYLIIDEPELNLHPDNQRNIARLLVKTVNRGINIILSTHSDYIVRELNNLIMLKENFKGRDELLKKYDYSEDSLLEVKDVSAYLLNKNSILEMEINSQNGILAETFDDVINSLNSSSDDIYYSKMEDLEVE
jgi:predicted ATPase